MIRIFILGFMGSGKTHWSKIWAEKYKLDCYDLDDLIVETEGLNINDIFHQKGETYFRAAEATALRTFSFQKNFILSCGGGTPCFLDNMDWMKSHGITIYLKATPATIAARLINGNAMRPLVRDLEPNQMIEYAEQKIIEREAFYLRSSLILTEDQIDTESLSVLSL